MKGLEGLQEEERRIEEEKSSGSQNKCCVSQRVKSGVRFDKLGSTDRTLNWDRPKADDECGSARSGVSASRAIQSMKSIES